jgi:TolA-binding protein
MVIEGDLMGFRQFIIISCCLVLTMSSIGHAQDEEGRREAETVDRAAKRLYEQALDYLAVKQYERGLTMLDTVIRDNSGSILAYRAHMAKGKHYLEQNKTQEALNHFMLLSRMLAPGPDKEQSEEEETMYKESLFNTGLAYYNSGQYGSCFPAFRRLTEIAGRSQWANQAYFYIGMSHYALKNWNKAIDALNLVGTEVSDAGEGGGRVEIGHRFYAKITDDDFPVLKRLGKDISATIVVSSGDMETLTGVPIAGKKNEMLVSAPTQIGNPNPNDGVIQIAGGDTLESIYKDASTLSGEKDVIRRSKVKAVSTGTVGFYLGDLSTPAYLAYPGQPQTVLLRDADLDTNDQAQTTRVRIKVVYKVVDDAAAGDEDLLNIFASGDKENFTWKERDSIDLLLTEIQKPGDTNSIIRTGLFVGKAKLAALEDGVEPDPGDDVLHCDELDEMVVEYVDKVHLYGDEPRENSARIKVSGKVHHGVDMTQHHVTEKVLRARKFSVEAEALKGLGLIYADMGLSEHGSEKADQALKKVDTILQDRKLVPGDLVENAFKLKWESEFLKNDFEAATATCKAFSQLYPESVLADQALMTLSRTLAEQGRYEEALTTYQTVLSLKNPISAAEAQYRIGEVHEMQAKKSTESATSSKWTEKGLSDANMLQQKMATAIQAYSAAFNKYPESPYAAKALEKVARYYAETDDYARAVDLFEKVTSDYPDSEFMDEILFLWGTMGIKMNNNALAKEKLNQLLYSYPASSHAEEARKIVGALE